MRNSFILFLFTVNLLCSQKICAQKIVFTDAEQNWIDAHPVVEFGCDSVSWAPYEIYENGEFTGIVNDFLTEIERETGIEMVPIKNLSWTEVLQGAKDGDIHVIANCIQTEERNTFLDFTATYMQDAHIIATRKDFEFIGNLLDLEGKKVAIPANFYSIEPISRDYPEIELVIVETVEDCLKKLSFDEVDAFIGSLGVVSYYINNKGFTNLKIAAPTVYENINMSLAVTKDWKIFAEISQKIFNQISSEKKSQFRKKWISIKYDHGITWKQVFLWVSLIIGLIILITSLFLVWNKSLKKQIALKVKSEKNLNKSLKAIQEKDNEKRVLLQEIHHRVKNNLQIITSLIRLQASTSEDENAISSLNESVKRIRAIALIHDKIYNSKNLNEISTKQYIESLITDVISNFSDEKKVDFQVDSNANSINLKSIVPLALILNELIANSLKYGLKDKNSAQIRIKIEDIQGEVSMRYFDNGTWVEGKTESTHFGTSLIDIFTEQLEGKYQLNKMNSGTEYLFTFKNSFA